MNFKELFICVAFSFFLMVLFILINLPYYRITYGDKAIRIVMRTILLNSLAIVISWIPVVHFWPEFSLRILLPFICTIGGLGCVGSRFIYHEIVPETLAKSILETVERNAKEKKSAS
jgi:hypothetical protein